MTIAIWEDRDRFRKEAFSPDGAVQAARLRCGGVDVVVTSRPFQTLDAEIFLLHGIDVTRCSVIGLESSSASGPPGRSPPLAGRGLTKRCSPISGFVWWSAGGGGQLIGGPPPESPG